jgi:hypothetical protein
MGAYMWNEAGINEILLFFTEDELFELTDYLRCNAILIWDYAQKGGGSVA